VGFVKAVAPKFLYIADLDRIEGSGSHDAIISACSEFVTRCYVDRGCRSPDDMLAGDRITNVIGTETGGSDLLRYHGGMLSIDVKDGHVIPSGADPIRVLRTARSWHFEGCILLNLGAVGTEKGTNPQTLGEWRDAYDKRLLYGGGVADVRDLDRIHDAGFDGAIIATALHKGAVPMEWIRRGVFC
jgi:phosphoribosylformimino-5-aminoimidazole carboxamide ribotide isomerase